MITEWQEMTEGERLARVARVTDDIYKQLRLFNEGIHDGDYNAVAKIVYCAIEEAHKKAL